MDTVVLIAAQFLPFVPVLVAVVVWWRGPRVERVRSAAYALAAVALTAALVLAAGAVHDDPRPFVADPSRPPLFPHAADNGFPSDHTAYSATFALLVAWRRRWLGVAMYAAAAASGLARVAANVHHLQDVLASLIIAMVAVAAVSLGLPPMVQRLHRASLRRPRSEIDQA